MKNYLFLVLLFLFSSAGFTQNKELEYELYLTQISAAEALLQLNKISEARKYLNACAPEHRDIEWHFLNKFLDQSNTSISKTDQVTLTNIKISPDEKTIAVSAADSTISLYSFPGLQLLRVLKGHTGSVSTLDFSSDGQTLASGGRDHTVILWNIHNGQQLFKNDTSFTQGIYQVRFNPDKKTLGVVSWERVNTSPPVMGFAKILDAHTGQELKKIETEPHPASGIVFANNGQTAIVATWGEIVYAYDTNSGNELWSYDLSDPEEYNAFHSIDLSPDGKTVLLGSTDHRIHLLDSETGKLLKRIEPWEGHSQTIKTVQYTADGMRFASAGEDQSILVWDAKSYTKINTLIGHTGTVTGLCWSKDGTHLLSTSSDGTLKSWNMAKPFAVSYTVCDYGPWQLPVTSDNALFAAPCSDKYLGVYQITNGEKVVDFENQSGLCGDISKDGQFLVTASFDGVVHLWDIKNGLEKKTFSGHPSRVDGIAYLDKTGTIVSVGDHTLRVWDVSKTDPVFIKTFEDAPFRIITSPDESKIYIGFTNGKISILNTNDWQEVLSFSTDAALNEITISPNGKQLAITNGRYVEVRNAITGIQEFVFDDHDKSGYAIGFSPDGRYLISGSYDQTFKLWNLANGRCTLTFHGYQESIYQSRFLEERILLLSSSQGRIFYYDFR